KRIEDLAVLLDEARDLRAVVVGSVLVRPGVDNRVPGLPEQRPERTADGVAVGVVRPHHGDLLVGRDLWPQVGVRKEELLHAKAVMKGRLEWRRLADFAPASQVPGLPGHDGRDAGNAGCL